MIVQIGHLIIFFTIVKTKFYNFSGECVDKIPTCHVAVQARLCQYEFYAISCCAACRRAPIIS